MTKRILITGGFGYVGGRVAQALSKDSNYSIILGSRISRRVPEWLPSTSIVETDWNDTASLRKICNGIDTILHFAAMNEIDAALDPAGALEMNGVATVKLLEAAKTENVTSFIYLSTAHVYASPLIGDIDETNFPVPVHPYATSHRAAEDAVFSANLRKELKGIILRLSNSFGAPAHPGINRWSLLVNDLCRQAIINKKLVLNSAGLQRRDFVTLTDVCSAISHLMKLELSGDYNGIFNVGGNWSPTIFEMAVLIAERCKVVLGFSPEIIRHEENDTDVSSHLNYKIEKLLSTGFRLKANRNDEIDSTLLLCKNEFS